MKDFFKSVETALSDDIIKAIAIALCVVLIFTGGYFSGSITGTKPSEVAPVAGTSESGSAAPQSTAPSTEPSAAPTEKPSEAPSENKNEEATTAPAENKGEMTTAEILKLYNDSANKVKTNATKVVKNYEDREFNTETLVVPGVLKGMVSTIVPKFMGDDTEPIEYVGTDAIKENFIVPGQDYVSVLTEADVVEATCTDNGTEYEIMIKVKDETNPVPGKGVGAAFDVIETGDITSSEYASMLEKFDTNYFNCVLKCKIDKASGNMTWANYMTPLRMDIVAKMMGTHNVSAEISFEKDYNI
ncbi:MAG: hypothetical protein IJ962_04995, partial [Clostridia bacterium]|nr:hypothetical protein [Clostridia bacterium]